MKSAALILTIGWASLACASAQPVANLGALGPAMLKLVAEGASTLSTMPADDRGDRIWAAWGEPSNEMPTVRLVLFQRNGNTALPVWSIGHAAAYAPALSTPAGWRYKDRPVLLLRYQLGAAFVRAELYGIGENGEPVPLGDLDSALIETVEIGGIDTLRLYETADLKGPPSCLSWDNANGKLTNASCKP